MTTRAGQSIFSILKCSYTKSLHLHFNRIMAQQVYIKSQLAEESRKPCFAAADITHLFTPLPTGFMKAVNSSVIRNLKENPGFQAWQCFSSFYSVPSAILVKCTSKLLPPVHIPINEQISDGHTKKADFYDSVKVLKWENAEMNPLIFVSPRETAKGEKYTERSGGIKKPKLSWFLAGQRKWEQA